VSYTSLRRASIIASMLVAVSACTGGSQSGDDSPSPATTLTPAPHAVSAPTRAAATPAPAGVSAGGDDRLDDAQLNGSIQHLVDTYGSLRTRVVYIIDSIPQGGSSAEVVGSSGSAWYTDERAFQSAISDLPTHPRNQYEAVAADLAEAEEFLYSAGADAMASCDPANARRELTVADYFLRAVERQIRSGHANADYSSDPPQVDASSEKCSDT
jgi:hypothetical protein